MYSNKKYLSFINRQIPHESSKKEKGKTFPPKNSPKEMSPHYNSLLQGTYCLVETVISERDIAPAGEQLIILLGFRTTNKNNGQVEVGGNTWTFDPSPDLSSIYALYIIAAFCKVKQTCN